MDTVKQAVTQWLNTVVIGLNLCPFSAKPTRENRVRLQVSDACNEEQLLAELTVEMQLLDSTPAIELETTLLIAPRLLADFYDYTQFLTWAQAHLKREGWQGVYQLASFHPDYCFASADPKDDENLTNRAPYPILHIIREASLAAALDYIDDVEGRPARNKACVEALTQEQRQKLFPYLFLN